MLIIRALTFVSVISVSLLSVGCGFARVNMQRDYLSPKALEPVGTRLDADGNLVNTERVFSDSEGYRIKVDPIFKLDLAKTAAQNIYEKNLEGPERMKTAQEFMAKYEGKTCVDVKVSSLDGAATDLKRLYLKLRTSAPETFALTPLIVKEPAISSDEVVYNQGGTTYRSDFYTNQAEYCADRKIDLTRGFTIFVDRRHQFNLPVVDLVWATDDELKSQFASWPGVPAADPTGRREWLRERYTENTRMIRNAPHFVMPEE